MLYYYGPLEWHSSRKKRPCYNKKETLRFFLCFVVQRFCSQLIRNLVICFQHDL